MLGIHLRNKIPKRFYSTSIFQDHHYMLKDIVNKFNNDFILPQSLEYNRDEKFNHNLFRKLGDLGLFGVTVPEKYGGSELDVTTSCIIHEELTQYDPGFCLAYMVHSILFCNNLYVNGNESQKMKYLHMLVKVILLDQCDVIPCGSDVLSMKTFAEEKDHYLLNGKKFWITNGCIDDIHYVISICHSGEKCC